MDRLDRSKPAGWNRDRVEQLIDNAIRGDAFGLGVEIRQHAMAEDRLGERLDVLHRHVMAAVQQRARLGADHQRVRRAQAGAPLHPLLDEVELGAAARPRAVGQPHRVAHHFLGDQHLPHVILDLQDVGAAQHARRLRPPGARRIRHHLHFIVFREIGHDDVEQEAIELRFGQRIGAFELDRVLRGQHEERPLELIGPARGGDVILLHRLEQRGLRLRRRAVDLVGEDDLREDRPLHEPQRARAVILVEDLGAGDVGRHQVGRELDALEAQVENLRDAS